MRVRRLSVGDAAGFRELRLDGLQRHPEAFGSSLEEEARQSLEAVEATLATAHILGLEDLERGLVGVAGLHVPRQPKTKHRGVLWGMYIVPLARGAGGGAMLLDALIDEARLTLETITLAVGSRNEAALALYRRRGFEEYGFDRRALRFGDAYLDEVLMRLELSGA